MRSKLFKFLKLPLWLVFSPNYYPSVHKNFQSHDRFVSHKSNLRSKFANNAFFEFQSHDQFVSRKNNHEIETLKSIITEF
jgi:hypothetical protein